MRKNKTQLLVEIAFFAAIAFVLDSLTRPLSIGPWISFSFKMVPIFIISFRWGTKAGMAAGFLWGLLQIASGQASNGFLNLFQGFLEYFAAFALIGTAGLIKPALDRSRAAKKKGQTLAWLLVGILIGSFSRYLLHFIAGLVFWASYAPEGSSVFLYSLSINGASFLGETLASSLAVWLLLPLIDFLLTAGPGSRSQR